MATYYEKNAERLRQRGRNYMRLRRENNPRAVEDSKLKTMFGISLKDYELLFKRQRGVCAICFRAETSKRKGKVRRLCVDHDHATGEVRGLLCSWCNLALGYLNDDPLRAHSAMMYLEEAGNV